MPSNRSKMFPAASAVAALAAFIMILVPLTDAGAAKSQSGPADKVSASGSTVEVAGPGEEVELLRASVKLSNPTDLILAVTLECSITTELTTIGNDTAEASGTLDVWIEIDGNVAPVSVDDITNPGEVSFCNRTYHRTTSLFDDEDATITSFIRTRQSHGFNWLALDELYDSSNLLHDIVVKGRLTQDASAGEGDATATVAVGKRTLIIEPTKVANGETVEIS